MAKRRAGIIGIGSIAALSYGEPDDAAPYNHAGGLAASDRVELVAVADLLKDKQERFGAKWGPTFPHVRTYDSGAEMLAAEELDVVAVCVRGPDHYAVMKETLAAAPKAIFLEKPPTCSLAQADELLAEGAAKGIPITVSYSRHWSPKVLRMEQLVKEGLIGEVLTVVGYVGGTVLSFASHVTDLICQFAGYCPTAVFAHGRVPELPAEARPGHGPEPTLDSMQIEFDNGVAGVQIGRLGKGTPSFHCEVFGTEGMARAGIYIETYAQGADGKPIDLSQRGIPPEVSVFTVAYGQIADCLDGGPLPDCTNGNFLTVHEIGFAAVESILTGRRIELPNANRARLIFANG
ncbi:MAG TPA: Gfo/Idh/MocA family oxidoreductase [Phycisphaerae bacterium]|nr:Gfo/Idh/MocA family oxidoreductase [Phycisphaerae bacterium]